MSEFASDLSDVIETQQNRIRYLESEVLQLEQKLKRQATGPALYQQQEFEAAMEDRFPTALQAASLVRATDVRLERAAALGEETVEPRRAKPVFAVSPAK